MEQNTISLQELLAHVGGLYVENQKLREEVARLRALLAEHQEMSPEKALAAVAKATRKPA